MSFTGLFNEYLAVGWGNISLNYCLRFFWATFSWIPNNHTQFINMLHYIDPLIPHELYPTLIYHAATGEVPSLIHFNGADKVYSAREWWGRLWWNNLQHKIFRDIVSSRLEGAMVRFGSEGDRMEWRKICPKDVIDI